MQIVRQGNAALRHTTGKALRPHNKSAKVATAVACVAFGLPYVAFVSGNSVHSDTIAEPSLAATRLCLFAVPLLAGMITGLAAKHKPVRGVINTIAILSIPAIAIPGFALCLDVAEIGHDLMPYAGNGMAFGAVVPWLLLGCLGAAVGHRVRGAGVGLFARIGWSRTRRIETCIRQNS
jgi:hypothetical protein